MSSPASPLIAVFDVGKTNAKLSLVDPALAREVWSVRRPNNVVEGTHGRELDVLAIEAWLIESLRVAPDRERIAVIVPIAHGAAAVLVDHDGEVLAAPDYEDSRFDEVAGCLRTPAGGSSRQVIAVVSGNQVRTRLLSTREAARLMGVPDDYPLPPNYNESYHLFGDGLVVPVVSWLSKHLLLPLAASWQAAQ